MTCQCGDNCDCDAKEQKECKCCDTSECPSSCDCYSDTEDAHGTDHQVRSSEGEDDNEELDSESDDCESTTDDDTDDYSNDEEYDELDDDKTSILRGKWIYDGASSIAEMIEALQREIALLKDLQDDGWVLQEKVTDDHAVLVKDDY